MFVNGEPLTDSLLDSVRQSSEKLIVHVERVPASSTEKSPSVKASHSGQQTFGVVDVGSSKGKGKEKGKGKGKIKDTGKFKMKGMCERERIDKHPAVHEWLGPQEDAASTRLDMGGECAVTIAEREAERGKIQNLAPPQIRTEIEAQEALKTIRNTFHSSPEQRLRQHQDEHAWSE